MATKSKFVKAKDHPTSSKAQQVAKILLGLVDSDGPVPFETLCEQAEAKYPQDVVAAMYALEMVGAVTRYTFNESGSTKTKVAYQINPKVKVQA